MRFGAFLPTYWTEYPDCDVRSAVLGAARAAEALGYDSVWANDHVIAPRSQAGVGHIIEPLITLTSLVEVVPRMRLGTSVLVLPQRNAVVVAKQAAALDVLSRGRLILGVGVGWLEEEFRLLGADFERRGAVMDEVITAMRALWREPSESVQGSFYGFSDPVFEPKPVHGSVPVWIGGNTPAAVRRAALLGDAWIPFCIGLEAFREGVERLRSSVRGRDTPTIAAHMRIRLGDAGRDEGVISGSGDDVASALARYREAGLEYLVCDFVADGLADLLGQMALFRREVAPRLRE